MEEQHSPPGPGNRGHEEQLASLLQAAAAGDSRAFESFYNATAPRLLAAVRDNAGDNCESVMVDCYLEAWRHATEFDPSRSTAFEWLLELCHSLSREQSPT